VWETYDTDICISRAAELCIAATQRLRLHRCKVAHIVLLGDMAHGAIHTSARVASEELVCDQIMNVSEVLAQFISMIADNVESTCVHSTYGNHLRTVQIKDDNIHADNMEKIIPWWLKQRLKDRSDV